MYCKNCGTEIGDNQAFCPNCGTKTDNDKRYCPSCGKEVAEGEAFCSNCGRSLNDSAPRTSAPSMKGIRFGITPRSIVTAILLTIVTCGIYGLYWFVVLTNDINKLSGREHDTNGGLALLFSLITCGIYTFYWAYKIGEKRDVVAGEHASSNVIYLVLSLFGFGIIVYALAQDAINKAVAEQ
jgi:predicted nucleic acid-binding Zn ribbon protein